MRHAGTFTVGTGKGEISPVLAEAALAAGAAVKVPTSQARKPSARKPRNAANSRKSDRVDGADLAAVDRADGGVPLDAAG